MHDRVSFIVFIDDAKLTDVYWGLRISILFEILIAIMVLFSLKISLIIQILMI